MFEKFRLEARAGDSNPFSSHLYTVVETVKIRGDQIEQRERLGGAESQGTMRSYLNVDEES